MVVKLYGAALSTATRRAATILVEKGVPFDFISVDLAKSEHKTPEYLERHPFGQVPVLVAFFNAGAPLEDDGCFVYESRAIGRYIAEKYADQGPALIPTEFKAKSLFEQAAASEVANFDFFAAQIWGEVIRKKRLGLEPNLENFATLDQALSAKLDVYDTILSKQKYLAGDEITLVDLFHLPFGAGLPLAGSHVLEKPNVARWWKDITSRPSWDAVKDGVKSTA